MTRHQKRLSVPKSWPVERKTETFTVKAGAGPHGEAGVPLLVLLRDVLGYVDNRKEARYALDQGAVLVNGEPIADETRPIGMFDILAFAERGEYFRVFPDEGGRLALSPIDAESAGSKLNKIEDKGTVPGGDVQLHFHDGSTTQVDAETAADYGTGDSLIVDNDDGSVVAQFTYEEGALVTAVAGQHAGEIGRIEEIQVTPGSADNNVLVEPVGPDGEPVEGDGFETIEDYVVVIDENFIDADDVEAAAEDAAAAAETAEELVEDTEPADVAETDEAAGEEAEPAEEPAEADEIEEEATEVDEDVEADEDQEDAASDEDGDAEADAADEAEDGGDDA